MDTCVRAAAVISSRASHVREADGGTNALAKFLVALHIPRRCYIDDTTVIDAEPVSGT
jgi:hypothetical protein